MRLLAYKDHRKELNKKRSEIVPRIVQTGKTIGWTDIMPYGKQEKNNDEENNTE